MRDISEDFILQQDNAPAHRAKETVDLLSTKTPAFILPTLAASGWFQSLVGTSGASVQGEGNHFWWAAPAYPDCLGWTWPAYYWQDDQAVAHLPNLRACVEAKGGHFGHQL